jgi:hypothetical protein
MKKSIKLMVIALLSSVAMNVSALQFVNVSSYPIAISPTGGMVTDIPKKTMLTQDISGDSFYIFPKVTGKTIAGKIAMKQGKLTVQIMSKSGWKDLPISKSQAANPISIQGHSVVMIDAGLSSPANGLSVQVMQYDKFYDTKNQLVQNDITKKYGEIYLKRPAAPRGPTDKENSSLSY